MRPDFIGQIAKALARSLLVVFPPFVTLNFIVEWSETVRSQNTAWRQRRVPLIWCGQFILKKYIKPVESRLVKDALSWRRFLSAVLQVRWTVCSSGLGYFISIHDFHHSHHTVEVTLCAFVLILCVGQVVGTVFVNTSDSMARSMPVSVCCQ